MSDYTLGIKELDNAIGGIRKGSNIMLIGPSMSGREAIGAFDKFFPINIFKSGRLF